MSSFSVCAENVLIHNFFESDRLNSKYLFWNDTPPRPGLKRPGLFLCYSAAKIQKFFAVLFDATHNIFLCVDKKDRRSNPKCRGPAGLFCVSTAVCAGCFQCFCTWFVRFLSRKNPVISLLNSPPAGLFCTKTPPKFTGGGKWSTNLQVLALEKE